MLGQARRNFPIILDPLSHAVGPIYTTSGPLKFPNKDPI